MIRFVRKPQHNIYRIQLFWSNKSTQKQLKILKNVYLYSFYESKCFLKEIVVLQKIIVIFSYLNFVCLIDQVQLSRPVSGSMQLEQYSNMTKQLASQSVFTINKLQCCVCPCSVEEAKNISDVMAFFTLPIQRSSCDSGHSPPCPGNYCKMKSPPISQCQRVQI